MTFRCPYAETKVWCDRRESEDAPTYACDSCLVIFPDMYDEVKE